MKWQKNYDVTKNEKNNNKKTKEYAVLFKDFTTFVTVCLFHSKNSVEPLHELAVADNSM